MEKYFNKVNIILNNTNLTENSKKTYFANMKKIYVLANRKTKGFAFLKNINNIISIIENNNLSITTKKMIYISISQVLKNVSGYKKLANKYKNISLKLTRQINKKYSNNKMNIKQKKTLISYKELLNKVQLLQVQYNTKKNKTSKKKYLLGVLYILSDFTPRLDLNNMQIINNRSLDDNINNFLLYENNKYIAILNNYKTKKQYGKIIYHYKDKVNDILNNLKIFKQDYLFSSNKNKKPMISNNFSTFVKQTFDNISINGIRIIKSNHLIKTEKYQNYSTAQQEQIQNLLFQHSGFQSITTYKKIDL